MKNPQTWADNLIIQGMSDALDTPLSIIRPGTQNNLITPYSDETSNEIVQKPAIILGYLPERHYVALLPSEPRSIFHFRYLCVLIKRNPTYRIFAINVIMFATISNYAKPFKYNYFKSIFDY